MKQFRQISSRNPAIENTDALSFPKAIAGPHLEPDYNDGRIAFIRSFKADIEPRILSLPSTFELKNLGDVQYGPHSYPMYEVSLIQNPSNPFVRLSGLVHGDEEAGGKALLEFLERDIQLYAGAFNFIINPCVNPSGYETATLQAMNGYHPEFRSDKNTGNINRSFSGALPQQEARLIEASLRNGPARYLFAIDAHESPPYYTDEAYTPDDAPKEAWLYESTRDKALQIGRALTDSLPAHLPACDWEKIYDDVNDGGVIAFSPETTGHAEYSQPTSLDGYLFEHYTDHSFTLETPTGWKLENRIEAQLHFIRFILDTYLKRQ